MTRRRNISTGTRAGTRRNQEIKMEQNLLPDKRKKGDKHRNQNRNQKEPGNHDGTQPRFLKKKEEGRRETSTGTRAGTRKQNTINPALQPNSSRTRSKTTKELKPMLFKPVQCQSCQTKCTQCCTFHLLRFCITTFWFWRNFGIMKFSASQRLTCQTKWLNAGLSILHVSALEIIM